MKVVDTLNKQGIMRKVYETALDLSYGNREPGKRTWFSIVCTLIDNWMMPYNLFFLQQYLLRKAEKAPKMTERKTDSSARWFRVRAKCHSMCLSSYRQWLLSNQRARNLTSFIK